MTSFGAFYVDSKRDQVGSDKKLLSVICISGVIFDVILVSETLIKCSDITLSVY